MTNSKRPVGRPPERPSPYTEGVLDAICSRMVSGESIRQICDDRDMPSRTAVLQACAANEEFAASIARARELQQDAIADEIVDMADMATVEDHQVVKLRIWARQWRAAKLHPKKYGERVQTDSNVSVTGDLTMRLSAMSDDELARILADAAGSGAGGGVGVAPPTSE